MTFHKKDPIDNKEKTISDDKSDKSNISSISRLAKRNEL